jgi:signal transduction histidine kinase
MSEFPLDDSRREPMQIIQNEIDRLERIIGNLLDFAKPSKSQISKVSILDIIKACILLIQNQANKSGITLIETIKTDRSEILADPGQMKQVFLNILTNAIQATATGGELEITVSFEDNFIVTAIRDTGSGIPEHLQKVVFDPFVTTKDDGTGLGLSVVLRIVEEHGGRIEVLSKEGVGTTFSVFLPHLREEPQQG